MAYRLVVVVLFALALALALATGCSDDPAPAADGPVTLDDQGPGSEQGVQEQGPTDGGADAATDSDAASGDAGAKCPLGSSSCLSKTQHKICKLVGGVADWVTESCQSGELCLDTQCSAECADECNLNETRTTGSVTETCKPFSVAKDAPATLGTGLHDRARQYNAWLRKYHLPGGTVADAYFSDATYATQTAYHGTGDSAIWTGSYLAGEAMRLMVTGSKDAEASVEQIVEGIHRLFEVTGQPGYHARFTAPLNDPDPKIKAQYNPTSFQHHVSKYNGTDYFWNGNTSRDQNSGVVLGYAVAFDALTSTKHKQMIQKDMVAFCKELMVERKNLPVIFRVHFGGKWQEIPMSITSRYMVLNTLEYKSGKPWIQLGNDTDPTDYEHGTMAGFREYWPDYSKVLKQIPLIGGVLGAIPIPRSGSSIMLGTIFNTCLHVTEGDPAYTADRAAIKTFYDANISDWLSKMKLYTWLSAGPPRCWMKYYGLNIVWEPVYNLLRLEADATRKASYQKDVVEKMMWPLVKDHKNVFFSFVHAAHAPAGAATTAIVTSAKAQLDQFPPPPHALIKVTNSGKTQYPTHPQCPGISSVAIDVADRVAGDFIWQRNPFTLDHTGDPKKVYPGVDFMLPYWMGRYHGFYKDDAAGTCLRWQ